MTDAPEVKLKPCPFCGNARLDFTVPFGGGNGFISCRCGTRGPTMPHTENWTSGRYEPARMMWNAWVDGWLAYFESEQASNADD